MTEQSMVPGASAADSAPAPAGIGNGFKLWLVGVAGSLLGDAVLYFALGWVASAKDGALAGAVLTAVVVPRAVLLLFGGAIADRRGARQVMLVGDAVMLLVTLVSASVAGPRSSSIWLLIAVALCVGTVSAFYLPASGAMPRHMVEESAVGQALAMRQVVARLTMLAGAPLGGVLVALGGLRAALLFDAATFALMLTILVFIRVPNWTREPSNQRMLREIWAGLHLVSHEPLLRATLILVGVAAGVLLPVMSLVVPLLAHSLRWNAQSTGLVVGTFSVASVAVAFVAMWRGLAARVGLFSALGLLIAGAGVCLLAVSSWVPLAILAGAIIGLGNGLFSTYVGPLVLRSTPPQFTSRTQAINVFVQTVPLLVTNNALGWWADHAGARQTGVICALVTVAAGIYGCLSPALRRAVFR